jgi:hypothetical protein
LVKKAYLSQKELIDLVERNFIAQTKRKWGNIDIASTMIASRSEEIFDIEDGAGYEHVQL